MEQLENSFFHLCDENYPLFLSDRSLSVNEKNSFFLVFNLFRQKCYCCCQELEKYCDICESVIFKKTLPIEINDLTFNFSLESIRACTDDEIAERELGMDDRK